MSSKQVKIVKLFEEQRSRGSTPDQLGTLPPSYENTTNETVSSNENQKRLHTNFSEFFSLKKHPVLATIVILFICCSVVTVVVVPRVLFSRKNTEKQSFKEDSYALILANLPNCSNEIPARFRRPFIRFFQGPCRDLNETIRNDDDSFVLIAPLDFRPNPGESLPTRMELPQRMVRKRPRALLTNETEQMDGDPDRDVHFDYDLEETNYWLPKWDASTPLRYAYASNFTAAQKQVIRRALDLWSNETCIRYTEVAYSTKLRNTIIINKTSDNVGGYCYWQDKTTRNQKIEFGSSTLKGGDLFTIVHEFGHSLGLMHDHERPDRELDTFPENIIDDMTYVLDHQWGLVDGTPYDVTSVMHYRGTAFSKDPTKLLVMRPWNEDQLNIMGHNIQLSFNDIKRVNRHYMCPKLTCGQKRLPKSCHHGGYQDPKNCSRCRCPPGLSGRFCDSLQRSYGFKSQCGGVIELAPCQSTTLQLPTYPNIFPFNSSCAWLIKSEACRLMYAFEEPPEMQCYTTVASGMCVDWVEIRTDFKQLDKPGKFFCACSKTENRKILVNSSFALIHFLSFPAELHRWDGRGNGFKMTVHAVCNDSKVNYESCRLTSSGYDHKKAEFCAKSKPLKLSPIFDNGAGELSKIVPVKDHCKEINGNAEYDSK